MEEIQKSRFSTPLRTNYGHDSHRARDAPEEFQAFLFDDETFMVGCWRHELDWFIVFIAIGPIRHTVYGVYPLIWVGGQTLNQTVMSLRNPASEQYRWPSC